MLRGRRPCVSVPTVIVCVYVCVCVCAWLWYNNLTLCLSTACYLARYNQVGKDFVNLRYDLQIQQSIPCHLLSRGACPMAIDGPSEEKRKRKSRAEGSAPTRRTFWQLVLVEKIKFRSCWLVCFFCNFKWKWNTWRWCLPIRCAPMFGFTSCCECSMFVGC